MKNTIAILRSNLYIINYTFKLVVVVPVLAYAAEKLLSSNLVFEIKV